MCSSDLMLLNNEEKGEAFVAENYDKSIEELTWHLIKEQLLKNNDIKVGVGIAAWCWDCSRSRSAQG